MPGVVEVADYHGPYAGSFIASLRAVGRGVREQLGLGYHCVFSDVARGRPWLADLEQDGVAVSFLDLASGRAARAGALAAIAREHDAVLMRSHFTRFDVETALAGRRAGAAVAWQVHTGDAGYSTHRRSADLVKVRLLGRLCDRVVAVSEQIGREARDRGYPAAKVTVVPNGIDVERFSPSRLPSREAARERLGLATGEIAALGFCWSPRQKGADLMIAAAGALRAELPLTMLLVGTEPLREFVAAHGAGDAVRVVEPVQDPRELYAAADVFVSASRQEAFSFSIGEALATGLPVVSSDIPGPAPYFAAGAVTTFPSGDAGALAGALRTALDGGDRAALAQEGGGFVRERFGMERHVEHVIALFGELLDRRGRGAILRG